MKRLLILVAPFVLLLLSFHINSGHTVTGIITDENGKPIPQVSIVVKGSSIGSTSGADGNYKITVPNEKSTLIFSYVGYTTKEVKVKGKKVINVTLTASAASLSEVVVVGYGNDRASESSANIKLRGMSPGIAVNGYYGYHKQENYNTEDYDRIVENGFLKATANSLSTFSIDVDAASYSNVRRFLQQGQLPPEGAVRTEEMINYFSYNYEAPKNGQAFSINTEIADCPWNTKHKLVMIGMQGKKIPVKDLPSSNLVFLIDVSGSMEGPTRLELVKSSLKMLVDQLREEDKVAIVVYAGAAGLVLPSTSGSQKIKIKDAIENLRAGGSTAGGQGIKLAYKIAKENFEVNGNNRVILCTDGDFNVGVSSDDEMERLIEHERKSGVFLTVLGYGMGNYKDNKMQKLADKGNGNHAYIDGLSEAKKVLVNEFGGTLFTIAKDVKLQVEFNPAKVQGYRLIGYENRMLNKEDFNDDKKDAGDLGSGHTVTALYEIIPAGVKSNFLKEVDDLKYQKNELPSVTNTNEIMTIKFRYKDPSGDVSKLIEHAVFDHHIAIDKTSDNFRFAASVAQFGMLLRNSEFKSNASYQNTIKLATAAKGKDAEGYRAEYIKLLKKAFSLQNSKEDIDVAYDNE